ncbi:hypothetical protein CC1G_06587 [Coprinopsis cinerea okayama7|uniref:Uncharacterized protein n=1 Tax=Coprinopsis cinerea (strain Okayama-7 / 130 / ATCC MYA-4618 / FGSC 9003) TaxID=240176 RepID=A8N315_COPC7|nr:hypothetical protein CC1G_06587 [Coprinopsis cinerea okayama7\|eukprot:XP_001829250.1 hypothetical protein CC1G_06587 [Coprinopsis cinerea okayama7\
MSPPDLNPLNTTQAPPSTFPFTFRIPPRTDLWRKPPSTFSANQPTFYTPITLKSLRSATVKIKEMPYSQLYDQAGVVFIWAKRPDVWIKFGVEFYEEQLRRSTVAPGLGGWSDWSVGAPVEDNKDIVVHAEREKDEGSALIVKVDGIIIREIQGFFVPENENETIWVGVYGARPAEVEEDLDVEIEEFKVEQA